MQRVQKILSNYGYCSRRDAEKLIEEGRVKVNGKTITIGDKATENDEIKVDGKRVVSEKKVYILFNKPIGCVTAVKDAYKKTVLDYIDIKERIFPIGRLDHNTSGLLLLTNDGDFANKVMHPSYEVKKTYKVELERKLHPQSQKELERGVIVMKRRTPPAKIKNKGKTYFITIHEGRNKIVKRMFKEVGHRVSKLERVQIGNLSLGSLKHGKWRYLKDKEREDLVNNLVKKKRRFEKRLPEKRKVFEKRNTARIGRREGNTKDDRRRSARDRVPKKFDKRPTKNRDNRKFGERRKRSPNSRESKRARRFSGRKNESKKEEPRETARERFEKHKLEKKVKKPFKKNPNAPVKKFSMSKPKKKKNSFRRNRRK